MIFKTVAASAAVASLVGSSMAVYVDEAYSVDWHKQQIGPLSGGAMLSNHVLAVRSELDIIGALDSNNGDLLWRRQVSGSISGFSANDDALAVGNGNQVSVWNPTTGGLKWNAEPSDDNTTAVGIVGDSVYACTNNNVYQFDSEGKQVWSTQLEGCSQIVGVDDNNAAGIITTDKGISLNIVKDQKIAHTKSIASAGEVKQVCGNVLLWQKNGVAHVATLGGSGVVSQGELSGESVHMRVTKDTITLTNVDGVHTAYERGPGDKLTKAMSTKELRPSATISFEDANGGVIYQQPNGYLVGPSWTRDEGLAYPLGAVFVDLPELATSLSEKELDYEEHADLVSAYIRRVMRHVDDLKELPHYIKSKFSGTVSSNAGDSTVDESSNHGGDLFGFRKYLVVATRFGRLVAIDTVSGQTVWELENISTDLVEMVTSGSKVLLVGENGQLTQVDGLTGQVLDQSEIHAKIDRLLTSSNGSVKAIGAYTDLGVVEIENTLDKQLYFVTHDGHTLYGNNGSTQTWSYNLGEEYKIVATAQRHKEDVTASIGTILGDRRVLYKYLHPNAMAVAAVSDQGALAIYLIETVTGRILHSKVHDERVSEDVSLVYGEHWIVYSYYSEKPTVGAKVAVWDLYESETPNVRLTEGEYSSFDSFPLPHVKSQAYFYPSRISSLAITRTKFGVTLRDVRASTEDGQIVALPKRLLDARRPIGRKPTKPEMEEGLSPHEAVIPKQPAAVLTHSRQVFVDHMITQPASLESTSLIGGWGLDIFFTRTTPSLPFDILNSNFGKTKLLYTIGALVVIVNILLPWVNTRALNQKWM